MSAAAPACRSAGISPSARCTVIATVPQPSSQARWAVLGSFVTQDDPPVFPSVSAGSFSTFCLHSSRTRSCSLMLVSCLSSIRVEPPRVEDRAKLVPFPTAAFTQMTQALCGAEYPGTTKVSWLHCPQTSFPHFLQWCRGRRSIRNSVPQALQASDASSGSNSTLPGISAEVRLLSKLPSRSRVLRRAENEPPSSAIEQSSPASESATGPFRAASARMMKRLCASSLDVPSKLFQACHWCRCARFQTLGLLLGQSPTVACLYNAYTSAN
mmetsp:Transcript_16347/g.37551  ORF Transcript_16347/g.37551 Transcript_16347/m.37551 type:complete len:269 (-) Transcript_16347:429-1235(-)